MEDLSVLLVDDEEEFTSALAERLNLRGIRTRACSNGEDALKMIALEPPRIVVLDLMMPGISGREMLAVIRANHPQIGVILLTGHGCVAPEGDEFAAELCDLLVKPVNIDELIRRIRWAAGQKPETGGWKSDGG